MNFCYILPNPLTLSLSPIWGEGWGEGQRWSRKVSTLNAFVLVSTRNNIGGCGLSGWIVHSLLAARLGVRSGAATNALPFGAVCGPATVPNNPACGDACHRDDPLGRAARYPWADRARLPITGTVISRLLHPWSRLLRAVAAPVGPPLRPGAHARDTREAPPPGCGTMTRGVG